jgi:hypothetical protein
MLNVIMLSVIMLNVVIRSVLEPLKDSESQHEEIHSFIVSYFRLILVKWLWLWESKGSRGKWVKQVSLCAKFIFKPFFEVG